MKKIIDKLAEQKDLSDEEFLYLLENEDPNQLNYLRKRAVEKAKENYGWKIFIRGLIEFSNYCIQDCYYCGLRRSNKNIERYRLSLSEILNVCRLGDALGFRTFVLQSGEDSFFTDERMVEIIKRIREEFPDHAITLSLGVRNLNSYSKFKEAGANRYLLRHESSDEEYFNFLHPPTQSFLKRAESLDRLRCEGFTIGSGMMIGTPKQNTKHILKDIRFLKELNPEMIGIGPFLSQKDTPFSVYPSGSPILTFKVLAIVRLMLPKVLLPATTSINSTGISARVEAVLSGANVIMPNLSPIDVRKKYAIYDNKAYMETEAGEGLEDLKREMEEIGYNVVVDRGDPIKGGEND